ncbi:MAG: helix-turn-helix transcriptional regulator [Pseudomonadota bacterium]
MHSSPPTRDLKSYIYERLAAQKMTPFQLAKAVSISTDKVEAILKGSSDISPAEVACFASALDADRYLLLLLCLQHWHPNLAHYIQFTISNSPPPSDLGKEILSIVGHLLVTMDKSKPSEAKLVAKIAGKQVRTAVQAFLEAK